MIGRWNIQHVAYIYLIKMDFFYIIWNFYIFLNSRSRAACQCYKAPILLWYIFFAFKFASDIYVARLRGTLLNEAMRRCTWFRSAHALWASKRIKTLSESITEHVNSIIMRVVVGKGRNNMCPPLLSNPLRKTAISNKAPRTARVYVCGWIRWHCSIK